MPTIAFSRKTQTAAQRCRRGLDSPAADGGSTPTRALLHPYLLMEEDAYKQGKLQVEGGN